MRPSAFLAFTLVSLALVGCSNSGGGSGGSSSPVSFTTGQAASLVLSEAAFNDASYLNNAGDGLLFNHQKGMDSDGTNLVLADGNNNRVLIWDTAPTANTPPDWVLGQPDFVQTDTNNSSDPLAQLSWPVDVAVGGGKLFVADSENDRVLVWNTIPSSNQAPADYAITGPDLLWPWGLWCDGTKLIVTSTSGGKVLIWNTIPTTGNEAPDLILTSAGEMGTPRTITTDGSSYLMVADHNPTRMGAAMSSGVFYWSTFPTSDVASDSFIQDGASTFWMVGAIDSLSRLFWLTQILYRFDTTPIMSAGGMMPGDYNPDLSCDQYVYDGGDGTDMVLAGGHLYISLTNKNKIVGFGSLPTMSTDTPDFVVGSNSLDEAESSLETRLGYITNPNPVTDGKRLVVGSDFDRKIYIYDNLPTTDNARSDVTLDLAVQPWSLALVNGALMAFARTEGQILIWNTVPTTAGAVPDVSFTNAANLGEDATMDASTLWVLRSNKIAAWDLSGGYPATLDTPDVEVSLLDADTQMGTATRITSDGTHLLVTVQDRHRVLVYETASVLAGGNTSLGVIGGTMNVQFNLPSSAILSHGKLFVADTSFHRVHVWDALADALAGESAAAILGQADSSSVEPKKSQDGLFQPANLAFDGTRLFVGEFKFSGRLVEFVGTP